MPKSHALNVYSSDESKRLKLTTSTTAHSMALDSLPLSIDGVLSLPGQSDVSSAITALQADVISSGTASNTVQTNLNTQVTRLDAKIDAIIDAGDSLDQVSEIVSLFQSADASVVQSVAALASQLAILQSSFNELTNEN